MEIRFFKHSEIAELKNTIHTIWQPNHILSRNDKLLTHMFYDNPANSNWIDSDQISFLGAWIDNKVIGILGVMPFEMNNKGIKGVGCSLTNWLVLPEYRNTGAGFALLNKVLEFKPEMILSLGINSNVAKLYKKMKWSILQDVPRWIGIVNKKKTVQKLLNNNEYPLRYWNELEIVPSENDYQISCEFEEEGWNQFYSEHFALKTIGFSRGYHFIKWRYLDHPDFKYHIITCKDNNNNYKGLAVVRIESIFNNSEKIGRVVEFIAIDQNSSIKLANAVIELDQELLFMDFYCFSSISTWGLEAVGFKKSLQNDNDSIVVPTRFQPLDLNITNMMAAFKVEQEVIRGINLSEESCFYITKGDSDQDRPN